MTNENKLIEDPFIEAAKAIFLKTGKPGFILLSVYDLLVKRGEIEPIEDQEAELLNQTEFRMQMEATQAGMQALKDLAHSKASPNYLTLLKPELKRQAVANYFTLQHQLDNF